jgi:ribosomal protein S18 acetylase RimI-like enzyme
MILTKPQHLQQAKELCKKWLDGTLPNGLTCFGIVKDSVVVAAAGIRCYHGYWFIRAVAVHPDYRGRGYQRMLLRQQIQYLKGKASTVRANVLPANVYSSRNFERVGFEVVGQRKIDGEKFDIYEHVITD